MEYKILLGSSESLEEQVSQHLRDGWQCQGGVAVVWAGGLGEGYAQAMVRDKYTGLLQGFKMIPEKASAERDAAIPN